MNYEEIIEAIRQAGGGPSRGTAACAAQATPQTLAERLIRGEARCILQELPAETVTRVSERTTPLLAPTAVGSTTITAATWPPRGFAKSPDPGPVPYRGDGPGGLTTG